MKPKYHRCELFDENFWFFINWKPQECLNYLADYFNVEGLPLSDKRGCAINLNNERKQVKAIFINKETSKEMFHATLAHECIHAANMVFVQRDVKTTNENDELLCYYVSQLIKAALR